MLDIVKAKPEDTHFHLAKKKLKHEFLQCWQSSECWWSWYVQCSPQTFRKLPASLWYKFIILFSLPTKGKAGQPTQETAIPNERMIYILSGVAFILLLALCFILGFWCYRQSQEKRIKRLFTKHNKFISYCTRNGIVTGEILNERREEL